MAFDQWYQRRQRNAEGEFYRKIAGQGPRNNFQLTTQGLYIASGDGRLLAFNNNRGPERIRQLLKNSLLEYQRNPDTEPIAPGEPDSQYLRQTPEGASVVRVNAKVLGGYPPIEDEDDRRKEWRAIFQNAISRDNMWISAHEKDQLVEGRFPERLAQKLARFHLIDNTRGEPPMWKPEELRSIKMDVDHQGVVSGEVHLETEDGARGFMGQLRGQIDLTGDELTQFDLVARGEFWGEGRYTGGAPPGKFPFAVAFRLADGSDIADVVPPQGTKGWLEGYK